MTDYQIVHEAPAGGRERAIAMQASQKVALDAVKFAFAGSGGSAEDVYDEVVTVAEKLFQQVMAAAAGQGSTTKEG